MNKVLIETAIHAIRNCAAVRSATFGALYGSSSTKIDEERAICMRFMAHEQLNDALIALTEEERVFVYENIRRT